MSEERSNAATDEAELERLDDQALARLVKERANQPTIQVSVADLSGPDDASEGIGFKAEEMRGEYRAGADPVGWVRPEAVTRHDETVGYAALTHPTAWPVMDIEEAAYVNPRVDKTSIPDDLPVSFVPMPAVGAGDGLIQVDETRPAGEAKKGFTAFLEGDVLFAKITPCMENGKMAVVPELVNGYGFGSTEFHVLRPKPGMDAKYLYYYVSSQSFRRKAERHMTGAVGQRRVPTAYLKECKIPVAPLDQQKLIVAVIEKQFSRLDEAVANLKRVKANLKRYKAAVLKAAVEGRLVETQAELARLEGRGFEAGEQLLQRILETRRSQWKGKGKYKEPAAPDTTDLPQLPEGWVWATPDQLAMSDDNAICAGPFGTIFKAKDFRDAGVPIIFLRHVSPGQYLTHKPGFMGEQKWQELFQPYSVYGGELLITKLGEPPGACAIYPVGIGPAMVTPDVIKMSVNAKIILSSFLMFYFNSESARKFSSGVAFGTTRTRLTIPIFREMPVAVPPLTEQHRIVAEVDRRLSLLHETEAQVDSNLQRAQRLRQSILSRAFSGVLLGASGLENPIDVGDVPLPAVEPAHCAVAS